MFNNSETVKKLGDKCLNLVFTNKDGLESIKSKGKLSYGRKPNKYNNNKDGDDNDYKNKNNYKNNWNNNADTGGIWKQEDTAEKAKLKEKALAMQKKVQMEKNEAQKIRLILNVITPDNFEKKFGELRAF